MGITRLPSAKPESGGKEHILAVEDDADILELIRYNLVREGYRVSLARDGEDGLRLARITPPDLVVLDLMLPGMDGLEVCRRLRRDAKTRGAAVIMLTAKGEESDVVAGLEVGADDYVVKPFSPRVLLARIRAVLRRGEVEDEPGAVLRYAGLAVRPERHEVLIDKRPVDLTLTEFRILEMLIRRPGWVFSRAQIVDRVRGAEHVVTDRSVDVHIVSLRKKLGEYGALIESVRGVGYRLKSDDEE